MLKFVYSEMVFYSDRREFSTGEAPNLSALIKAAPISAQPEDFPSDYNTHGAVPTLGDVGKNRLDPRSNNNFFFNYKITD